jgi:transposase
VDAQVGIPSRRRRCGGHSLGRRWRSLDAAAYDAAGPGPDRAIDGVVRWRRVDLQRVIKQRFGVDFHERYVGTILKRLGFSHMSARPRHPAQNAETIEAFKKTSKTR